MVVRHDDRRRIARQEFLDHLARIHRRIIDGAAEQFDVLDQPMPVVEKQHSEHFVLDRPVSAVMVLAAVSMSRLRKVASKLRARITRCPRGMGGSNGRNAQGDIMCLAYALLRHMSWLCQSVQA